MVEWSGELGSDITFFLSRGTAYCTGRGEIMTSIDPPLPAGTKVCIVKPKEIGLSTPAVFKALEYDRLSPMDPDATLLPQFIKPTDAATTATTTTINEIADEYFVNDLETPAFKCVPELAAIKDELLQVDGFSHVMMSGSGTSIFCLGEPTDRAAFDTKFGNRPDLLIYFTEFINRPDGVWFEQPK